MSRDRRHPISHALLTIACAVALGPFALGVIAALKTGSQFVSEPPWSLPSPWTVENVVTAFDRGGLGTALLVTAASALVLVVTQVPLSFAAAYALRFREVAGRRVVLFLVIFALLVPPTVLVVPLYLMTTAAGLNQTFLGVVLPFLLGSPWAVFLFLQVFRSIPRDVHDAARIDGLGAIATMRRVLLPLVRGNVVAVVLVTVVAQWNAFLWPLVIAGRRWPVATVVTATLTRPSDVDATVSLAAAALSTIPLLVLLVLGHRQLTTIIPPLVEA